MKHRKRLSLRASKRLARRTAKRTKIANLVKTVSRGGERF